MHEEKCKFRFFGCKLTDHASKVNIATFQKAVEFWP